ncbi:MAG: hypothetical protein AAB534_02280 [Patescibacteria group bacterium]
MDTILNLLYPQDQIFVSNPRFSVETPTVTVTCLVSGIQNYTIKRVPYITAENYVRILSQACYLLAHHVLGTGQIDIGLKQDDFLRAMLDFELYYRNLAMTFHERVGRDVPFEMTLDLKDVREIKRLGDFIIFSFANQRTVISGEMSFVYTSHR